MQQTTVPKLDQRIDQVFYQALVDSTGLQIDFSQTNYAAVQVERGTESGEVKLLPGVEGYIRFNAKCAQIPDMDITHSKLDLLHYIVYNYLVRTTRFFVEVDGVKIFGSATALRDHGFFKAGNEIKVSPDQYYGATYVRMAPLTKNPGRDNVPYHRFFPEHLSDLPSVHKILSDKAEVREISFLPDSFEQLLHEDAFLKSPESWG